LKTEARTELIHDCCSLLSHYHLASYQDDSFWPSLGRQHGEVVFETADDDAVADARHRNDRVGHVEQGDADLGQLQYVLLLKPVVQELVHEGPTR